MDTQRALVRRAVIARGETALSRSRPGQRPVIVKAISNLTDETSAGRCIAYVGRRRHQDAETGFEEAEAERLSAAGVLEAPGDAVELFDAFGVPVEPEEIEWSIPRRRDGVVARHLVFSIPVDEEQDAQRLRAAVVATLSDTFGLWGHPVVAALHLDDPLKPHVHVVVGSWSFDDQALRFDKSAVLLDGFRMALAEHAREVGFEVTGERETDRQLARALARAESLGSETLCRASGDLAAAIERHAPDRGDLHRPLRASAGRERARRGVGRD